MNKNRYWIYSNIKDLFNTAYINHDVYLSKVRRLKTFEQKSL